MKIGRPEHSLPPTPPTSDNILFLPYLHPPILPKREHMRINPKIAVHLVLFRIE